MNSLANGLRRLALISAVTATAAAQDTVVFACPTTMDDLEVDLGDLTHLQVDLGDLNSDGLPDEVALDPTAPHIYFHLGKGNGTYGPWSTLAGPICTDVAVGDVTGDGLDDIVTTEFGFGVDDTTLFVHPAIGVATFGAPVATATDVGDSSIERVLADMDADGRLDYVATGSFSPGYGYRLSIAKSWGPANFEISAQIELGSNNGLAYAVADFNTDGLLDVATEDPLHEAIEVYFGAGSGTLAAVPLNSPLLGDPLTYLSTIKAADFDADGFADLATSSLLVTLDAGLVAVMHGSGDGTFTVVQSVPTASSGRLATGDLDADGWPDLVMKHWLGLGTLLNDGTGGLLPEWTGAGDVHSELMSPGPTVKLLRILDVDGDGLSDVHLGTYVAKSAGDGSLIVRQEVSLEDREPIEVSSADLDHDGNIDLAATLKGGPPVVAVSLGDGDGSFEPATYPIPSLDKAQEIACGDIDGDGSVDLIIDPGTQGYSAVWINDGTGLAFPTSLEVFEPNSSDLVVADLNADGCLDVASSHAALTTISVRLNSGSGSLLPVQDVAIGGKAVDLLTTDLDADGTTDLVAALQTTLAIGFALGTELGDFAPAQIVDLGLQPTAIAVADFDVDGFPDLAACSTITMRAITIVRATSPASYGTVETIPLSFNPSELEAADFNRDLYADLITLRQDGPVEVGLVELLANLGDGTFAPPQHYLAGADPVSLAIDDVTSNGQLDLVVGCSQARAMEVLPNVVTAFPSLGFQHAASFGFPRLIGTGSTLPNQLVTFSVEGVPPPALGFLFLGLDFASQPFHGGTLVPLPDAALPMCPDTTLEGRWPPLPVGTKIYAQAWFAVGREFAGTNAIFGATQ